MNIKTESDMIVFIQKNMSKLPVYDVVIMVSINSTAVSVIIVPPMLTTTGSNFVTFNRLAMGYETSVCVENMQASSNEAVMLNLNKNRITRKPSKKGMMNVKKPNQTLLNLFLRKLYMSISSVIRNIRYSKPAVDNKSNPDSLPKK